MASYQQQGQAAERATKPSESPLPQRHSEPIHDLVDYLRQYAREKPEVAALWCFGIGFFLGWKLKLW